MFFSKAGETFEAFSKRTHLDSFDETDDNGYITQLQCFLGKSISLNKLRAGIMASTHDDAFYSRYEDGGFD